MPPAAAAAARLSLQATIEDLRVGAEADVLVGSREFPRIHAQVSADADLVFMGLAAPDEVPDFATYYEHLQSVAATLPTTAFVLASEDLDFAEVLT